MKQEFFTYTNTTENKVPAVIWLPDGEVKSVFQIVHGMTEHIGRYEQLAEVLTREGIAVAGFDLLGHGQNGLDLKCASFGEDGWEETIKDIHQLHISLKMRFANAKHYFMGFSLGSFLVREYFSTYEEHDIAGAGDS